MQSARSSGIQLGRCWGSSSARPFKRCCANRFISGEDDVPRWGIVGCSVLEAGLPRIKAQGVLGAVSGIPAVSSRKSSILKGLCAASRTNRRWPIV